ncbi:hypothetical protein ABZY36_32800 [Streptomyces sp. NPDC006627]|uniref:hypothetical protein n=1 Tax=Streptomyces sp. NPDC006627 TaxID=3154679 RepID=UPI0033BB98BC
MSEDWERPVVACLAVLCLTAAGEGTVSPAATMVEHCLALDVAPDLAVFRSRVGLAVLDLSPRPQQAVVSRRLIDEAITYWDGYVARDVLAHVVCWSA